MLEKHVSDYRLCIHGTQPPCQPCAQWSTSASSPLGGRAFSGCCVHWPLPVRRRASTEHLGSAPGGPSQPPCPACTPSRPKFRANAASVAPWLRSPAKLLSLRGQPFSPGSIAFTRARRSRFRAALPPRGRWQEVASSIRARPGLPRRWAGAPATGPGRWPWRTRGGARRRPKPRQNRSTAWVSGARIDWARRGLR